MTPNHVVAPAVDLYGIAPGAAGHVVARAVSRIEDVASGSSVEGVGLFPTS